MMFVWLFAWCLVAGGGALYGTADPYIATAGAAAGGRIGPIVSAATHSYHPYRR